MRAMREDQITPDRRRELATTTGFSEQYLYQCLTGRRDMRPAEASRVERLTNGELTRQMLCTKTWQSIWPELIPQQARAKEVVDV